MMEKQTNVIGRTIVPFLVILKFGASFEKVHLRLSLIFLQSLVSRVNPLSFLLHCSLLLYGISGFGIRNNQIVILLLADIKFPR
jgi:hypothetical protein